MTTPPQPTPGFEATVDRDGDVAVIRAQGEVDIATTPRLREAIASALSSSGGPLLIDLSEVTFMESTGLRVLLEARRPAGADGVGLAVVCDPDGPVRRLFELTNTLEPLAVCGSREEALAALSAG